MQSDLIPDEHTEQVMFVNWWRATMHNIRIIAIPNGGLRNKVTAARLKSEGVSPGVPDLFVPKWCWWIEMKRQRRSYLTKKQKDWKAYIESIGHHYILANGWEDGKAKVIALVRNGNNSE